MKEKKVVLDKKEILLNAVYSVKEIAVLINMNERVIRKKLKDVNYPKRTRLFSVLGSDVIKIFVR